MAYNPNLPVFAERYRFEPVSHDWDRGRSGYTHLVYDLKEERLGVIKRAEIISQQSTEGLKNEVKALKALKGFGVPEIYDTGRAMYGSKNYDYMVIEYIDGIRVEKNLNFFSVVERAEIITKLFGLLSQAHQKGIINGDIDLKHLFLRKNKKQLVVIDWGNAKLDVDPKKKTEFAYDLARAAEIIFSLVSGKGHPPATGSLSLPADSALVTGIEDLPIELRNLCKWAPRTPSDGAQAPYTAQELYEVSKKWLDLISGLTTVQTPPPASRWRRFLWILLLPIIAGIFFFGKSLFPIVQATPPTASATSIIILSETPSIIPPTAAPMTGITETIVPTGVSTKIATLDSAVTPSPGLYSPIINFDNALKPNEFLTADNKECWKENQNSPAQFLLNDGFSRRDDQYWRFKVVKEHPIEDIIQVDFSPCLEGKQVGAFALNAAVTRLEPERMAAGTSESGQEIIPGREYGFFLEGQNGQRREYTLWLDQSEALYLRIREDNNIIYDDIALVVSSTNIHHGGALRPFISFPIEIYFEKDNQGLDLIYLLEGSLERPITVEDMDPSRMIRVDNAVLPTLGDIQKIGLVGRGGQTEIQIWPLVFWKK